MRRTLGVLATLAVVFVARGAAAHAVAMRYDLPLPLGYYLVGAGLAVLLTFLIAGWLVRPAATERAGCALAVPPGVALVLRGVMQAAGALLFLLGLAIGVFGPQGDWDSNLLVVWVWVVWWVGLAFVCALLGNLWPALDPWATLARAIAALRTPALARPWPAGWDAWPVVILFLAFAWTELVWPDNAVPLRLACAITLYSVLAWTGMALFGIAAWQRQADPFALFFGWFGRFAPLGWRDGALVLRPWGAGLRGAPPSPAMSAFVLAMLATVGFDGLHETPLWDEIDGALQRLLYDTGVTAALGFVAVHAVIKTAALLLMPLAFLLVYLAISAWAGWLAGERAWTMARRFVATLVPIAIAYHLAHYLSWLLVQGQAALPLLSDPFGLGWDLLGTRGMTVDIGIVGARTVWIMAVAAIVAGHAIAVLLAHRIALDHWPDHRRARRTLLPLTVLMVAYTMLSLWILAQPVVA